MLPFRRKKQQQQQDPSPLTVEARREWAHRHAADRLRDTDVATGLILDDLLDDLLDDPEEAVAP